MATCEDYPCCGHDLGDCPDDPIVHDIPDYEPVCLNCDDWGCHFCEDEYDEYYHDHDPEDKEGFYDCPW